MLPMVSIMTRYIPGKENILADQLSHPDQVLVVSSSQGVQSNLRGVWPSSHLSLHHQNKSKASFIHVSSSRSDGFES